jgi:pSer/pThr/pTyr-binding forkhead associated (FHA) protein
VSDQLLIVFGVALLVMVYLVFLRVLRTVWVELRGGARIRAAAPPIPVASGAPVASSSSAPARSGSRAAGGSLVIVAPPTLAGSAFVLDAETTIGRAQGCRISIDDTHVSKVHARVFDHEGRWYVEDLGSTNGTLVNEVMVGRAEMLEPGDRLRVGETVMELQ